MDGTPEKVWTEQDFDPSRITRFCDVVMKGGVTSGVVYPSALCHLAEKFAIKNIGGTSVGAIAASIMAAAEWRRRQTGSGQGYVELSKLPDFLTRPGTLRKLFEADRRARPLLAVALRFTGSAAIPWKILCAAAQLLVSYWLTTLLALIVTSAAVYALDRPHDGATWTGTILLGALLFAIALLIRWGLHLYRVLSTNRFGWCHGFDPIAAPAFERFLSKYKVTDLTAKDTPPLTDWHDAYIAHTAGRDRDEPLTFGDLWSATEPPWNTHAGDEHQIDFRMVTTCVTLGRPFDLPFSPFEEVAQTKDPETDEDPKGKCRPQLYFVESELREYFPHHIVAHMMRHGATSRLDPRYTRFPAAHAVPVVVATRFSQSFPVLFSAVPLYAPDRSGVMQPLWFSDGGLSSNFPIHLFDSPMPRWPTFAIDLLGGVDAAPSDVPQRDVEKDVFLESDIPTGTVNPWNVIGGEGKNPGKVFAFASAIIDTMRTWQDTTLGTLPANRNRTVGLRLSQNEGGLNLNMPRDVIKSLILRGHRAGALLAGRFATVPDTASWQIHRWTRYRATMSALARWLNGFETGFKPWASAPEQRDYPTMIAGFHAGGSAPSETDPKLLWKDATVANAALDATRSVAAERDSWKPHGDPNFPDKDPTPIASLRMRPDVRFD